MLLAFVYSWCTWECSGEETIIFECNSKEEAYLVLAERVEQEFEKGASRSIFIGESQIDFTYLIGTNMSTNSVAKDLVLQEISLNIIEVKDLIQEL